MDEKSILKGGTWYVKRDPLLSILPCKAIDRILLLQMKMTHTHQLFIFFLIPKDNSTFVPHIWMQWESHGILFQTKINSQISLLLSILFLGCLCSFRIFLLDSFPESRCNLWSVASWFMTYRVLLPPTDLVGRAASLSLAQSFLRDRFLSPIKLYYCTVGCPSTKFH